MRHFRDLIKKLLHIEISERTALPFPLAFSWPFPLFRVSHSCWPNDRIFIQIERLAILLGSGRTLLGGSFHTIWRHGWHVGDEVSYQPHNRPRIIQLEWTKIHCSSFWNRLTSQWEFFSLLGWIFDSGCRPCWVAYPLSLRWSSFITPIKIEPIAQRGLPPCSLPSALCCEMLLLGTSPNLTPRPF